MRLRRAVQVLMAGLLAALLLAVFVPAPKAEAVAILPYTDNAMFVDSTATHSPGSVGSTYLWPTTGDFTVEVWAKYEGSWVNNTIYSLWQSNGYYLYACE